MCLREMGSLTSIIAICEDVAPGSVRVGCRLEPYTLVCNGEVYGSSQVAMWVLRRSRVGF